MISSYNFFYTSSYRNLSEFTSDKANRYDVFISAYTEEDSVRSTFEQSDAFKKIWIVLPEYGYDSSHTFIDREYYRNDDVNSEAEFINQFFDKYKLDLVGKNVCIDITGFVKPYIIYFLFKLRYEGFESVEFIYTEPQAYEKKSETVFSISSSSIVVRNIFTYDSFVQASNEDDLCLINVGYDFNLVSKVVSDLNVREKKVLLGFPSLQAIMYQENVINLDKSKSLLNIESIEEVLYSPANNPFLTAKVISNYVEDYTKKHSKISNIYLSPLATKPQAIGMAIFYIFEFKKYMERDISIHIRYPFTKGYSSSAGKGVFRVNKYVIDFKLFDSLVT